MVDSIQGEVLQPQNPPIRTPAAESDGGQLQRRGIGSLVSPRDVLDLPARYATTLPNVSEGEGGDSAVVERGRNENALGGLRGLVQSAVNGIRRDLSHLLRGFGFESEAANQFAKSFVEPVISAIKEGVSFTAELSFAAFSQATEVASNSFRQSTSLVARSLEISVNQETGDVAVSLASLTFEENITAVTNGGGDAPLVNLGPGPLALPPESGEEDEEENLLDPLLNAPPPSLDPEEDSEDPVTRLLDDLRANLVESAYSFQAIIAVRSISFTNNDAGEPVTNILVDAAVPLEPSEQAPEDSEPLNVTA